MQIHFVYTVCQCAAQYNVTLPKITQEREREREENERPFMGLILPLCSYLSLPINFLNFLPYGMCLPHCFFHLFQYYCGLIKRNKKKTFCKRIDRSWLVLVVQWSIIVHYSICEYLRSTTKRTIQCSQLLQPRRHLTCICWPEMSISLVGLFESTLVNQSVVGSTLFWSNLCDDVDDGDNNDFAQLNHWLFLSFDDADDDT